MLLVSIFLLALLTLGAVSATEDTDFNETLTVDETQEAPIDASVNDETSGGSEPMLASSSEDALSEGEITQDNFNIWVSGHEYGDANWDPHIINVWGNDDVRAGSINITISKDENSYSEVKGFDGSENVIWTMDELKEPILNDLGTYTVSLKYLKDETEIGLGDYSLILTKYDYNTMGGELYEEFPFDIIIIYDDVKAEVYVSGRDDPYEIVKENPIGWNLSDLDITSTGDYEIRIVTYDENDDVDEDFTFNLKIVDSLEWFRLHAPFNIQSRDLGNPILYLYTPDSQFGAGYTLNVTNENTGFEKVINFGIDSNWMNWTLEDFEIEKNEGYHVELTKNGEYITDAWLNVEGIIDKDSFNSWVSSHESINNEWDSWIVNVHAHGYLREGDVAVTVSNSEGNEKTYIKSFEEEANEDNDVIWTLNELDEILNQPGTYTFNVTYIKDETQVDLITDFAFTLTEYDYNIYEGEIYVDYPSDIIRIWDDLLEVEVHVDESITPVQACGNNPLRWTLTDLGIDAPGDYTITISASKEGNEESFTFNLNVFDDSEDLKFYSNVLDVRSWEIDKPVLYLVSRDEDDGKTFRIVIDGNYEDPIEFVINESVMSWTLEDLGIDHNSNYNVELLDGEDYVADTWINVEGILNENSFYPWVSSHEYCDAEGESEIAKVDYYNVGEGSIIITILQGEETIFTDVKIIDEDDIRWTLEELRENDVLEDAGTYEITLKYVNDETEIDLGEYSFTLTKYNYVTLEGDYYIGYPFDVIRIWDEDLDVEIQVNEIPVETKDDKRWTLDDLGITSPGEYTITINANNDGDEEEFSYTLNVYDEFEGFVFYSNNFGVEKGELDDPVLYLISREEDNGKQLIIKIVVDDENEHDIEFEINATEMNWTLDELGITENKGYDIRLFDDDDEVAATYLDVNGFKDPIEVNIWDEEEQGDLYTDTVGTVIFIRLPEDTSGMLDVIVNNTVKYHTIINSENHDDLFDGYEWRLDDLGITQPGVYNVTLKFMVDEIETVNEYMLDVRDFENNEFRAKVVGEDEPFTLYLFTPNDGTGTVSFTFKGWDDKLEEEVIRGNLTLELNQSYWNKWTVIDYYMDYDTDRVDININGEDIVVEYSYPRDTGNYFTMNDNEVSTPDDIVLWVYANTTDNDYTLNLTSGDSTISVKVAELGDYEWANGHYMYRVTYEILDSFLNSLNDKDKVSIIYDTGDLKSLAYRWNPIETYALEKNDDYMMFYLYEQLRVDLIKIELAHSDEEEDEEGEGEDESEEDSSEDSSEDTRFVRITVPDSLNIHETGLIHISYGDNEIVKNLSELENEYNYNNLAVNYYILLSDLNPENLKHKDIVNVTVTSNDELYGSRNFIMIGGDESWGIDYFQDSIGLTFYYGTIGDLEFGQGEPSRRIIDLTIPEYLNITDGRIVIADDDGNVIYSKSLDEFEDDYKDYDDIIYSYWIPDDDFNYTVFGQNVNFTVSFEYSNTSILFARGVREGDELHRITTPEEVANYFKVTLSEGILINGSDNAIIIEATDNANRQSVGIDLGGGYIIVYVNGKKVENLGSLVGFDGETELELYLLQRGNGDGTAKLYIYLSDLNITDNGDYSIRVTHKTDVSETSASRETELFYKNLTLTSNVKVDNVTSDVYTGFGMDPILFYLDTYYGNITSEVTGNITVLNSEGEEILKSDIKSLKHDETGYYLKYSDFKNKNFGDQILVMYEGNERSGNTTVNVTWKDVNATDFEPTVNDDVSDYYGSFVNINIPDLITTGQIIVTVKFINNPNTNISGMDVSTDFSSQAIYKFNVADIKTNSDGTLQLSLSDLGFYEEDGDYAIDVKFTIDGNDALDVANNTLNVTLSQEINMTINDTSRYTNAMPFASVKIYEPSASLYAELFIDGVMYSHKQFEKGFIEFASSDAWTPGNHTAEIRAYNEFGNVVASAVKDFDVVIKSEDVSIDFEATVREGKNVIISITVPKEGQAFIQIDDGAKTTYNLVAGANSIDLGVLPHGNHIIGVFYETALDDGNISFYNGYINVDVEYASWMNMPYPIVRDYDDTIKFDLGEGANGTISVMIDDMPYKNVTLDNGKGEVKLEALQFGKHSFTITYLEDPTITQSAEFEVTYLFRDDIVAEGYPLREIYTVTVFLPQDANGTVSISVDNPQSNGDDILGASSNSANVYEGVVKDGKAVIEIPGLTMGEHKLYISYSGDLKYPESNYEALLNVSYYAVICEMSGTNGNVSLMLPANATGNLTVYNNNRNTVVYSVAVVQGKAFIDLSNLPVGIYEIRSYYDGDDYEVRENTTTFTVYPKVKIAQDEVMGEDVEIFVDLDSAEGQLLIVIDGIEPITQAIVDGKVNYTFPTEGYSYGNHTVYFIYFGRSIDADVFNTVNENGRYVPIEYPMNILAINTTGKVIGNGNIRTIQIIDEDGNLANDADGTMEIYVDGVLVDIVNVENGVAEVDLSQYKGGTVTWKYSGNNKYGSSSGSFDYSNVNVPGRIAAKDLTVVYSSGGKYSVTVYNIMGNLATGTPVSFLINNKVYKTVNTNSKGVASVVISSNPGTYKITVKSSTVSVTKTLKVTHILSLKKVKVKRSAKKLVIQATLKKVNGKYLKGKKITLKFNGKKFTAKTNKKGVAKFTIKKNVLKKLKAGKKVKYQATYKKDTVKKTVKVKK